MRLLEKNKKSFSYLRYQGLIDVIDEFGFKTGEKQPSYSEAKEIRGHISKAGGEASVEMFGTNIKYDKTILLTNEEAKFIDEYTIFFIDKPVEYDSNNSPLYNYKVEKIASTINITAIAVSRIR